MSHALTNVFSVSALVFASLTFSGCGSSVSGTYSTPGDEMKIEFKSGGKVTINVFGMTKEGTYEVSGKTVKITIEGETEEMTIDDKGCLVGRDLVGTLCKK